MADVPVAGEAPSGGDAGRRAIGESEDTSSEDFPPVRIRSEPRFQNVSFNQLPDRDRDRDWARNGDGDGESKPAEVTKHMAAPAFSRDFSFKPPASGDEDGPKCHSATFSPSSEQQMRAIYGKEVIDKVKRMDVTAEGRKAAKQRPAALDVSPAFNPSGLGQLSPGRTPIATPRGSSQSPLQSLGYRRSDAWEGAAAAPSPPSPQWADRSVADLRTPRSPRSPPWGSSTPQSPEPARWTAKSPEPLEFGPRSPTPGNGSSRAPARRKYVDRRRKASHSGSGSSGSRTPIERVPPAQLTKGGSRSGVPAAASTTASAVTQVHASLGSQLNISMDSESPSGSVADAEFELKRVHRPREDAVAASAAPATNVKSKFADAASEKKKLQKTATPIHWPDCGGGSSGSCQVAAKISGVWAMDNKTISHLDGAVVSNNTRRTAKRSVCILKVFRSIKQRNTLCPAPA